MFSLKSLAAWSRADKGHKMEYRKFLFILPAMLTFAPACMFYPGFNEDVDPTRPIVFSGFSSQPNQKIYIYIKNGDEHWYLVGTEPPNPYVTFFEATSSETPYQDKGNPPSSLYPWRAEGTLSNYQDWGKPLATPWAFSMGGRSANRLVVMASLVPPNENKTGPSEDITDKALPTFRGDQQAKEAMIKYISEHPNDWTFKGITEIGGSGNNYIWISGYCGNEGAICCNDPSNSCNGSCKCITGLTCKSNGKCSPP